MHAVIAVPAVLSLALAVGCKPSTVAEGVKSAGETVVEGAKDVGGAATSLVNVNLSNVLNDLAVRLNIERADVALAGAGSGNRTRAFSLGS